MKKILILLSSILLILSSCELFYEKTPYEINLITIGLDYYNTDTTFTLNDKRYSLNLDGTINDATDIEKTFKYLIEDQDPIFTFTGNSYLYLQEGTDHTNETIYDSNYPSKEHIITALENLSNISDENTINIIYYSGHGDFDGSWALATTDATDNYPINYDPSNDSPIDSVGISDFSTDDQLLSIEEIYELLEDVEGYTVIISDSCYSGNFYQDSEYSLSEDDFSLSAALEKLFSSGSDNESIFFISASSNDNSSYEFPEGWNSRLHGVFTYALLEGLGWDDDELTITKEIPPAVKDGILSLDSLVSYINENLDYEYFDYIRYDPQELQTSGWRYDLVLFQY